MSSIPPSERLMVPFRAMINIATLTANMNGHSNLTVVVRTTIGSNSAEIPAMTATLKMFEPTTLPIATSELPSSDTTGFWYWTIGSAHASNRA